MDGQALVVGEKKSPSITTVEPAPEREAQVA
jgi:hypothetical protein